MRDPAWSVVVIVMLLSVSVLLSSVLWIPLSTRLMSVMRLVAPDVVDDVDESDANASNRLPSLIAPGSLVVIVTGVTCLGLVDVIGVVGFIGCRL